MPIVVAVWPNNTISVISMPRGFSMTDLFNEIDQEANPLDAKCYQLGRDESGMYASFDWDMAKDDSTESVGPSSPSIDLGMINGRKKRLHWPRGIARRWLRRLGHHPDRSVSSVRIPMISADELRQFPTEPVQTFTVSQVRAMDDFAGVYFAYNEDGSCHYVGESSTITTRVISSRPEIGSRRIGLLRCEKHERKLIEAYFVALLDPPGNAASTHRMLAREATDGQDT